MPTRKYHHLRGLTKFAKSPLCACRGSSGQKPQYGVMMLAYQVYYLEVLQRLLEKVTTEMTQTFFQQLKHHDNAPANTALSVTEF
jgi:hypothetical protein